MLLHWVVKSLIWLSDGLQFKNVGKYSIKYIWWTCNLKGQTDLGVKYMYFYFGSNFRIFRHHHVFLFVHNVFECYFLFLKRNRSIQLHPKTHYATLTSINQCHIRIASRWRNWISPQTMLSVANLWGLEWYFDHWFLWETVYVECNGNVMFATLWEAFLMSLVVYADPVVELECIIPVQSCSL